MLWKVGEILRNQHLRRLMDPRQSILHHNYSCVPFPFLIHSFTYLDPLFWTFSLTFHLDFILKFMKLFSAHISFLKKLLLFLKALFICN